ncbi:putative periplasmic or secreted lipoprotein [Rivularia sp. PCC 7116]|uniref:type II toxin-antitoxin system HicA family toxin n=1 Tax=Rivularia sp. PCC 7116 TaxID=373994 RepID=UPI00029F0B21|nr:type II toxin-antitoxin system HicA family toxin [Rivularia sp. PCC 7116]AFY55850.1 putative periplasmic or secreted lipoprotein [Rivularia sp. PCC 7116]
MKAVSGKAMCKILERQGWVLKRVTGSHHIYSKEGVDSIISVPVHSNRDLPTGTLKSIMKDAALEEEDLS